MSRTILLVEDFEDSRLVIKLILEGYGYLVDVAVNGFEAIASFKHHFPDLILMDIAMPGMDGLTATKAIRKLKGGATIPIIAVTAFGKQCYEKAIEAGCNEVITKPINFDAFEPVIHSYLHG